MSKFKINKGDGVIWAVFACLCIISIIEVFSASSSMSYRSGNYISPMGKHAAILAVGVFLMMIVSNMKCKYFKLMTPLALLLAFISLVCVWFIGKADNDAARWIPLMGGLQFQPSELAKGAMILAEAQILAAMQTPNGADRKAFKYIIWIAGGICGLIFFENFSTALLLALVVFIMMWIGNVNKKQLFQLAVCAIVCAVLFLIAVITVGDEKYLDKPDAKTTQVVQSSTSPDKKGTKERSGLFHRFDTWKGRINRFLDNKEVPPEKYDLLGDGAQPGHANIAIVSSHLVGRGPGNSVERDFLSQAFSDFIFAIIIEELGLAGAAVVCLLYIILMFRAAKIANRCENCFPAFLVMGLALMLCLQAMFNMMVAVGLGPVTGQPLPLISKGGTSTILNCIYIGVILSVSYSAKRRDSLVTAAEYDDDDE